MLQLRRPMSNAIGLLVLAALVVPPTVMAGGPSSIRAQVMRSAAAPVGGTVTQQELPGCSNPSEPFAGASQGCASEWSIGDWAIFNGTVWSSRGPRQTTSHDLVVFDPNVFDLSNSDANRGPRQTTSLDGSINPETGSLSVSRKLQVMRGVAVDDGLWYLHARRGPWLSPEPTYNSALSSTDGVMGYGWSFPFAMSLRVYRGVATITQEDGSNVVFKLGADKRFHAAPRVVASLRQNSLRSYTLTRGSSRPSCPSYLRQSCEVFTFKNGHLSSVSRPDCKSKELCGNGVIDISHDRAGRPTSATAGPGESLTFGYTAGHISSITGRGGVSEHFTYNSQGNLTSATDPNGNAKYYVYGAVHRVTAVRDPLGHTTRYAYSSSGRVTAATDPLGHTTTFQYDGAHHTTTITSPEGRRVVLSYQARELVDVAEGPAAPPLAEWTFAFDPKTLAGTEMVDAKLHKVHAVHNGDGLPLSLTDALGNTTTFTYSDTARQSSVTDPMGVKTTFRYDEHGNVLTESTPISSSGTTQMQTNAWSYEDHAHPGDMTSSTDPLGNETDYTYDSHGLPATVTDPLGNTWTYAIKKACFNKTDPRVARRGGGSTPDATVTDPLGHTTSYTCDANGNLLTATDENGATTTNTYDADDELTSTTDPAGRKTAYSYDADGQLTAVHRPDGTTSHATYGADGELTTTVDPAGGTRSFTYDELGRRVTATDQLGGKSQVGLDNVGNVTSFTDAMGVTATNTYDADNQLLSTDYSNGATPPVSYTYDADGRRTSMTDGTGRTAYDYDSLGRLTRTVDGSGATVVSTYDLAGDRTALQYPNGHTVTMQYDANGQMTCVTDWLGNTTQTQYDTVGRWKNIVLKRGFCGPDLAKWKTTTWGYDAAGHPLHITMTDANGVEYASFDYTRAADGRITAVDSTGLSSPPQTYGYDANGRLGSENAHPVTFDSRDNVTGFPDGSTLSYDAADRLVSRLGGGLSTSYTFNADGERTGASSAAGSLSYSWTCVGCLASFTDNGATTTYALNGDGQRIMAQAPNGVHHTFTWDSSADVGRARCEGCGNPWLGDISAAAGFSSRAGGDRNPWIGESSCGAGWSSARQDVLDCADDPASMPLSDGTYSFIYGPGGMPIEQIDNAGHALFLDEDAQGSVRVLTDAAGNVQGTASYDAFGNQVAQNGASSPFGFDGMYRDSESGLYAMSGGVYDPATGQALVFESRAHTVSRLMSNTEWAAGGSSCGNCAQANWRYTGDSHICTAARGRDGFDDSCPGRFSSSPYSFAGGDPVNGSNGNVVIGNVVGVSAVSNPTVGR